MRQAFVKFFIPKPKLTTSFSRLYHPLFIMSSAPGTILSRCAVRCSRSLPQSQIQGYRAASSTPFIGSDVVIPPESPLYTYIPTSPQTKIIIKKPHKGSLPRPRHALKVKGSQVKWHIENTVPEPVGTKTADTHEQHKELVGWKAEETRLRRMNFQTGFKELHSRRKLPGRPMSEKTRQSVAVRHARLVGPEPLHEEMSRPSMLSFMNKQSIWGHSRRSKEETEVRKAEFAKAQQLKEYERRTGLHTLYINAKEFIVTDDQLEKRLTKVFDSDFYRYNKNKQFGIWDEQGWPEDTAYLMNKAQSSEGFNAISLETGYTEIARRRIMKVTEEMTGGKLLLEDKDILNR